MKVRSLSQRLRSVLYVLWEQQGSPGTFEEFYRATMEKIISYAASKLEEK